VSTLIDYAPMLWSGLLTTLALFALGSVLTVFVAFVAGLGRLSRRLALRGPAAVFIELFRGTSMIVQLFWFFYALPLLGVSLSPFVTGVLVLGLNEGAYAAEIVRGAIRARPIGQTEACVALGISPTKALFRILIPQSVAAMIPPFGNVLVDLLKTTSLVSTVTVLELTNQGLVVRTNTGETATVFVMLLIVYLVLSLAVGGAVRLFEKRFGHAYASPTRRVMSPLLVPGRRSVAR
jgi:polar amino acid transport system permease protein